MQTAQPAPDRDTAASIASLQHRFSPRNADGKVVATVNLMLIRAALVLSLLTFAACADDDGKPDAAPADAQPDLPPAPDMRVGGGGPDAAPDLPAPDMRVAVDAQPDSAPDAQPDSRVDAPPDAPAQLDTQPDLPVTSDVPIDGGACRAPNVLRYMAPGCGANAPAPVCGARAQDACAAYRCSCEGKVIVGCDYFEEPFARYLEFSPTGPRPGEKCDPVPKDAGGQ